MIIHLIVSLFVINFCCAQDKLNIWVDTATNARSAPVNPSFASNSVEWFEINEFMGVYPNIKQYNINLLRNLVNLTGGSPVLRIGGNSADSSIYNPNIPLGAPAPPPTPSITATNITSVDKFASILGAKIVWGLNFYNGTNADWAVQEMKAINKHGTWANNKAFEVGNEIDMFSVNGLRPSTYNYTDYVGEFDYYVSQLTNASIIGFELPTTEIFQGSTACCSSAWMADMPAYFALEKQWCPTYSIHWYPEDACGDDHPTLEYLLSTVVRERTMNRHLPLVKAAQAVGREYWIGESNSVACAGKQNVSDVMGAGLWAIDYMLTMASINVSGINFHHGGWYSNFVQNATNPEIPEARGLFYGEWFFTQTVRAKSVALTPTRTNSTNPLIIPHVFLDLTDGTLRVVAVHMDLQANESVVVTVNITNFNQKFGSYSNTAGLVKYVGPSVYSVYGLSVGGQTFDGTPDGSPQGKRTPTPVTGSNGVYTFTLAPTTAGLLEIPQVGTKSVKLN